MLLPKLLLLKVNATLFMDLSGILEDDVAKPCTAAVVHCIFPKVKLVN